MAISSESFKKFLKERNLRDIIYSLTIVLFFVAAAFIFIRFTVFLTKSINSVAGEKPAAVEATSFDLVTFSTIATRLRIPFVLAPPPAPPVQPSPPSQELPAAETTEQPAVEEQETAVDITKLSLRILNGTAVVGLAKKWQGYLGEVGFKAITVGNAAVRNYTGVTIQYKSSASGALEKIKEVVTDHGASVTGESQVGDSESYDVTLIIGK